MRARRPSTTAGISQCLAAESPIKAPQAATQLLRSSGPSLASILEKLEKTALNSPPLRQHRKARAGSPSPNRVNSQMLRTTSSLPSLSRQTLPPTAATGIGSVLTAKRLPHHVRCHVLQLFEAFTASDQPVRPLRDPRTRVVAASLQRMKSRREGNSSCASKTPSQEAGSNDRAYRTSMRPVTADATAVQQLQSFETLLRTYYRSATRAEMEAMLTLATPSMAAVDRRRWVAKTKATHERAIRMAFLMSDADGDGELSLQEFADAVAIHRREGTLPNGPNGRILSDAELEAVFHAHDKDRNGQLDLEEFLDVVGSHPSLACEFEGILRHGVIKRIRMEERKLQTVFRSPWSISPSSRGILSPSGRRRRPSLFDLRVQDEVRLRYGTHGSAAGV